MDGTGLNATGGVYRVPLWKKDPREYHASTARAAVSNATIPNTQAFKQKENS